MTLAETKHNFSGGELSKSLQRRSDLEIYRNGLGRVDNFLPLLGGGLQFRPGVEFIVKYGDYVGPYRGMFSFVYKEGYYGNSYGDLDTVFVSFVTEEVGFPIVQTLVRFHIRSTEFGNASILSVGEITGTTDLDYIFF
jgi:hypothetical protein